MGKVHCDRPTASTFLPNPRTDLAKHFRLTPRTGETLSDVLCTLENAYSDAWIYLSRPAWHPAIQDVEDLVDEKGAERCRSCRGSSKWRQEKEGDCRATPRAKRSLRTLPRINDENRIPEP